MLDELLYKERYSIERTNAWMDSYRKQVRYHTNQLGGMELYRIYTDCSEKDKKVGKVQMTSIYNLKLAESYVKKCLHPTAFVPLP